MAVAAPFFDFLKVLGGSSSTSSSPSFFDLVAVAHSLFCPQGAAWLIRALTAVSCLVRPELKDSSRPELTL